MIANFSLSSIKMYTRVISRSLVKQGRLVAVQRRVPRFFSTEKRHFSSYSQLSGSSKRQTCFISTASIRSFSSGSEEPFRRFRSFKSGEQFSKKFINDCVEFTVSVAYSPKDRQQSLGSNDDGGRFIQDLRSSTPSENDTGTGEDNYIIAYTEIGIVVGVLDGVGGWSDQGFDSSAISRELAQNVTRVYMSDPTLEPMDVLNEAFKLVKSEGNVQVGSTTICFGIIDADSKTFQGLNLGDSWFGVFRKNDNEKYQCVFQSDEQVYYFNAPYQLSIIPQDFLDEAKSRGSKYLMNDPVDGKDYSYQLQSDDVVIFTTDGLVDNIFPDDIELYLNDQEDISKNLGEINNGMVNQTKILSLNTNFKSVFSQKLSKETGQSYIGGKPDDITSVMVYIK